MPGVSISSLRDFTCTRQVNAPTSSLYLAAWRHRLAVTTAECSVHHRQLLYWHSSLLVESPGDKGWTMLVTKLVVSAACTSQEK